MGAVRSCLHLLVHIIYCTVVIMYSMKFAEVINSVQDFLVSFSPHTIFLTCVFPGCNVSSWLPSSSCWKTTRRHLGRFRRETWRSSSDFTPSEAPLWLLVLRFSLLWQSLIFKHYWRTPVHQKYSDKLINSIRQSWDIHSTTTPVLFIMTVCFVYCVILLPSSPPVVHMRPKKLQLHQPRAGCFSYLRAGPKGIN